MHWMTACADCGQTLRVWDRREQSILCPRCGSGVTTRRPRQPAPRLPAAHSPRRYWPWLLGIGLGVLLAMGSVAATLPNRSTFPERYGPMPAAPSPPPMQDGRDPFKLRPPESLRPPRPTTVSLEIPLANDGSLGDLTQAAPKLKAAGRIPPLLAVAGEPGGCFLTADVDGVLRCYSASLQPRGEARLDHVPYLMTLDAKRGRLYAAVSHSAWLRLSTVGDREQGIGDLCVYDVAPLLAGTHATGSLKPTHVLELESQVSGLHLSADGACLCYLADSLNGAHFGRVTTATMEAEKRPVPASGMSGLADEGDGKLVALAGGVLYRIDTTNWEMTRVSTLSTTLAGVCPAGPGRIFALERRHGNWLVLLDLAANKVAGRFAIPYQGRFNLVAVPGRLFLGTSAVFDGRIQAFDLAGSSLTARGVAERDDERLLRGGLHVTPDGRYLLSGNGHVFHAPERETR